MPDPYPFPIDLVEPCPARAEGDPVPRHLFIPVVAWHEPLPPVIRMRPRREHWLIDAPPVRPVVPSIDPLEPPGLGGAFVLLGVWCLGATLLVVSRLLGWL